MSSDHEIQVGNTTSPNSYPPTGATNSIQNHPSSTNNNLIIGLEEAIDQTGSYIYIKDIAGRYVYANNKVRKFFNESLDGIVGKDDSHFFNSHYANNLRKDDLRVLANGETIEKEETLGLKLTDAKQIFWVIKKPIKNNDGQVIGLCGVSTDITERKRAEELFRSTSEELKESQSIAGLGTYVLYMGTGVWKSSPVLDRLFGIDESYQRTIKGWESIIYIDDRTMMHDYLLSEVIGNRVKFDKEYRIVRVNDNAIRWMHGLGKLDFDENGMPVKMQGTIQDISERKLADEALRKSEELYRKTFQTSLDAISITRMTDGAYINVNESFLKTMGFERHEVVGHSSLDLNIWVDNSDRNRLMEMLQRNSVCQNIESRFRCKSGKVIWGLMSASQILVDNDPCLLALTRDISERKQAEESLRITASVFGISQEAVIITDTDNNIIDVNPAFTRITGYSREDVIGKNPKLLGSGKHDKEFYEELWKSVQENGLWRGEIWNRRKSGEIYPEMLSISVLCDSGGKVLRYVAVFSDISNLKKHEAELVRVAHFDALTSIPNRVLLADRMKQAISQTSRDQNIMAVCYLDLDGFKPINDTLGHQAGDEVLIEIATRISKTIRGGDTVARLGGDEFVVLLLGLSRGEECVVTLERLLVAIAEPFIVKNKSVSVSASIGVSIYPLDEEDPDTLLRHADQAMYVAKQSGRNRFHIYDVALDKRARDQNEFLKSIRRALEFNQFELHYQPKVNLRTKELVGVEALIRWRHPERGLLAPAAFLRHVENTDLDIQIGEWVTANALAQMHRWRSIGLDIEVSINISGYHMESSGFVEKLQQQLAIYPDLPLSKLQIEVLETVALNDIAVVQKIIESCRKFGVGFALDDFGTGYSSLSYLSALPVDTLKIDQSFVRDMLDDKGDMAIVHGIIALAKAFERQTVAEGIENEKHYQALLGMGCDIGQGYGIALPMPADDLAAWQDRFSQEICVIQTP
jgi:diguanylate cyclase (GGDEF)-like protein/PAS domain S-box-containing protein